MELTGDVGRATFLARTREGYGELCRLVTRRRLDADFSLGAALTHLSENVYALADDERVLARLHGRKNAFAALPAAIGREWTEKRWRLRREAARLGLRTVAAGEIYFLEPREHFVHRVLTAIRTRATVGTLPAGAAAPPEAFFHSPADVERVFHDDPASIEAALEIAEACRFDLDLHSLKLPRFALAGGEEPFAELRRLALRGLKERMGESECVAAESTLERELAVVRAKGLADYFLICRDIVRFARSRGMSSVGRGSAGNSLISYALKITHVNPLRHNLFFERFLNPERTHLPDFDIDFGTDDREEVLRYIFRRYGAERVAMIGTYSTLKARAAIREVAKALGIPEGEVDPFIKRLPYFSSVDRIEEKCAISPAAGDIPFDREPLRTILKLAARIGEFPRHMATHPCGLVICPEPITNFIPLQRGDKGYEITQWSMHEVEAAGLLKIDIIGQKGLAVIGEAAAMAAENEGRPLHPEKIDYLGDPASRETLRAGRTEGCFYIESPAMVQLIRQAQVRRLRGPHGALVDHTPGGVELRRQAPVSPSPPRARAGHAHSPGARARARRHVRLPHLPGAGDPHRRRRRRDEPRRGGRPAPLHGVQERRRRDDGELPRVVHARGARARDRRGDGGGDIPADRVVRGLRLLQGAFGLVRPRVVRERLLEDALPGRVHGGGALERRRVLLAERVSRGGAAHGARDSPAVRERERGAASRPRPRAPRRAHAGEGALGRDGGEDRRGAPYGSLEEFLGEGAGLARRGRDAHTLRGDVELRADAAGAPLGAADAAAGGRVRGGDGARRAQGAREAARAAPMRAISFAGFPASASTTFRAASPSSSRRSISR